MNQSLESGFSLVELAIVVALATILIAIGMPNYGNYRKSLLKWQVREQLLQDLRGARQIAITQHSRVTVVFGDGVNTTDLTSYSIQVDENADGVAESRSLRKLPKGSTLTRVQLAPQDSLTFETSGILQSGSGGGQLVFTTKNGQSDTLIVSVAGMVYHP